MRKYENHVQKIKSQVLKEVAHFAFKGTLEKNVDRIPYIVNPGPDEKYRCCIYHERAISEERVKMAMGGSNFTPGIVEVLEAACDQCPVNRFVITETCRGCIAHRCINTCPVDAITMVKGRAQIDADKCVECGLCKESCPYNAIADVMRPCKRECPTNAIKIDHRKKAVIDYNKCISCGACVYHCPFGAMQDKSEILPVIDILTQKKVPIYAMVAPAFATQFNFVDLEKVITGIKMLGFKDVVEVALGADLVVQHESEELLERMSHNLPLSSSCCPSFVQLVKKKYPELTEVLSKTVSPMMATARLIKNTDPEAVVVFIGPCISKKMEKKQSKDTDFVLTFEELAALIEAKAIDLTRVEPSPLNNASYFGRKFAASGGVSQAIQAHLSPAILNIQSCDGIAECEKYLKLLKTKKWTVDFIEGMACKGGCIKGPVTMHHGPKDLKALENYAKRAIETSTQSALTVFALENFQLDEHHIDGRST